MSKLPQGKIKSFIDNNLVLIVFVPWIIGMHWGWAKIQDNPKLCDQEHKKDIPIFMV